MELKLAVFRFLPTTQAETSANKMRPQSSRTVQYFPGVYLQAQITVHTHLMNYGYFDPKPYTPNWSPHAGK